MAENKSEHVLSSVNVEPLDTLRELLEELYVPRINSGFDEPLKKSDFLQYTTVIDVKLTEVLDSLKIFFNNFKSSEVTQKLKKVILSPVIIVRGEHFSSKHWATDFTIKKLEVLVETVLHFFDYSCTKDALIDNNCYLFNDVLLKMRPWLLKESWKNYPAAIACYKWVLEQIESPHLSDHLNVVLPTALIITDDFESENRIIGLKCLEHIIEHVGMTHLSWHGQDKVVLKAIEPLFYFKDIELISPLSSTFVALLKKKYPLKARPSLQINEFDDMIDRFLQNMIFEQRLALRSSYLAALPHIILARGLGIVLHSTNLNTILPEYILEPSSSVQGLHVLQCYIDVCWPRIHTHCTIFLTALCKVCLGIQTKRFPDECGDLIVSIVSKLHKLCPGKVEPFFDHLKKNENLKHLAAELCV